MLMPILKRLLGAIPNILGVIVVTFLLTRALPGDPAAFFAGPAGNAEAVEEIREKLGLNRSMLVQFGYYARDLARGDWGVSLSTGQPVLSELAARLPASLELTLAGLLLAVVIAIPLGVLAATRPGSWIDHLCRGIATAGVSLPTFFTGMLLAYIFYFLLGWSPAPLGRLDPYLTAPPTVTGFYLIDAALIGDWPVFRGAFKQLILPAVTLGLFVLAPLARMTRASMLGVLSADFIRTARASGLSSRTVVFGYAFRNALLPVMTTLGMVFSFLLGSNVLVEKVFAWPGIGSFAIEALVSSDYAPVQGFVLAMALLYVLLNLTIDIAYGLIDPRVRLEG
jgi:ABC-type dipeptide/oligopeptide/nickel transport system permease component